MATAQTPPGSRAPVDGPPGNRPPENVAPRRSDRSPWNWLLLIPIVVPLLVPLYNAVDPTLGRLAALLLAADAVRRPRRRAPPRSCTG